MTTLLDAIFAGSIGCSMLDASLRICRVNQAWCNLLNASQEEFANRAYTDIIDGSTPLTTFFSSQRFTQRFRHVPSISCSVYCSVYQDEGASYALLIIEELTATAKTELLANMSHELRTPLNAIIGFSEIMKEQMFSDTIQYVGYSRDIYESGMHLLKVIDDILDMSSIELDIDD